MARDVSWEAFVELCGPDKILESTRVPAIKLNLVLKSAAAWALFQDGTITTDKLQQVCPADPLGSRLRLCPFTFPAPSLSPPLAPSLI